MYLRSVSLRRQEVASFNVYPYSIPAVRALYTLELQADGSVKISGCVLLRPGQAA